VVGEEASVDKNAWRERQAQWDRFHDWELLPEQTSAWPSGQEAARVVGELIELYRSTSPPPSHDDAYSGKIRGIQRMHRLLQRVRALR